MNRSSTGIFVVFYQVQFAALLPLNKILSMLARIFVSFLIGAVLGAVVGYHLKLRFEDTSEFNVETHADEKLAIDQEPVAVVDEGGESEALTECRQRLAMVRNAHEQAIKDHSANEALVEHLSNIVARTSPDQPMEFPDELESSFQPEEFSAAVDELKEECPHVFPSSTRADCSEFPCIIEFPYNQELETPPQRLSISELCGPLRGHLPTSQSQMFVSEVGDEVWIQYMPYGSGVGLDDQLADQQLRLFERGRRRWDQKQQSLAIEQFEDTCLVERDIESCRQLADTFHNDPDQREIYQQIGCDADDPEACHSYAYTRCISLGRCDTSAEHFARRAIELNPTRGMYYGTLATILCERHQRGASNGYFRQACELGYNTSCARSCE